MNILQTGNPRLKEKSRKIPLSEITGKEIKKILRDMKETLRKEPQGIGLAAIQIGIPKNIFIVSKYVLDPESFPEKEDAEKLKLKKEKESYLVFINPRLVKSSRKKALLPEGCLSVRKKFGVVKRATNLTIEAYDENGNKFVRGAGGLLAHVVQHELDHLDGVLFTDKTESMEK